VLMPEKQAEKIYFLLMVILLILPVVSWGTSGLYVQPGLIGRLRMGLLINGLAMALIMMACTILILVKILRVPNGRDFGQLTFGLLADVIIFLYVFQNELQLAHYIDIYICTIGILLLYFLIINRKSINVELSLLSTSLFAFISYHHEFIYRSQRAVTQAETMLYYTVPALILVVYAFRIHHLKTWDRFTIPYFILSIVPFGLITGTFNANDANLFLTVLLVILPFFMAADLLITVHQGKLSFQRIAFYIRTDTLVLLSVLLAKGHYFDISNFYYQDLSMFAYIMLITIVVNILESYIIFRNPGTANHRI
jgi:hypothetical protein